MARLNVFVLGIILAVAFNFVQCSTDEIEANMEVLVVADINDFLLDNPGVQLKQLEQETLSNGPSPYMKLSYKLGQRIRGDRLLATDQASQQWNKPNDVNTNLHYPKSGIGAVVTYLEIICDQSTNLGRAYIVSGGIGQRQIAVVLEARHTLYFSYQAAVYGNNAAINGCCLLLLLFSSIIISQMSI